MATVIWRQRQSGVFHFKLHLKPLRQTFKTPLKTRFLQKKTSKLIKTTKAGVSRGGLISAERGRLNKWVAFTNKLSHSSVHFVIPKLSIT